MLYCRNQRTVVNPQLNISPNSLKQYCRNQRTVVNPQLYIIPKSGPKIVKIKEL